MARNAKEEQTAAEVKDKVQTVKKSLEEQQHRNNRTIAAKEAAVEASRDGGC